MSSTPRAPLRPRSTASNDKSFTIFELFPRYLENLLQARALRALRWYSEELTGNAMEILSSSR